MKIDITKEDYKTWIYKDIVCIMRHNEKNHAPLGYLVVPQEYQDFIMQKSDAVLDKKIEAYGGITFRGYLDDSYCLGFDMMHCWDGSYEYIDGNFVYVTDRSDAECKEETEKFVDSFLEYVKCSR